MDVLRVYFNSLLGHHKIEELVGHDAEDALVGVKLHLEPSKHSVGLLEIGHMVTSNSTFHQYVIHVNFHIPPNLLLDRILYLRAFVYCSSIFKAKWHHLTIETIIVRSKDDFFPYPREPLGFGCIPRRHL